MKRRRPATLEPIAASAFVIVSLHVALMFALVWWWQNHEAQQMGMQPPLAWLSPTDFKTTLPVVSAAPPPAGKKSTVPANAPKSPPPPNIAAAVPAAPAAPPSPLPAPIALEPPVQKAVLVAAPPDQHRMEPAPNESSTPLFASATPEAKPSANRSITLRRTRSKQALPMAGKSPAPPISNPSLLDIARLNTMRPDSLPKAGEATAVENPDDNTELDVVDEALNTAFLAIWTAPPIDAVPPGQREARLNLSLGKDGEVLKAQMSKFSGSHVLDQSILEAAVNVKKIPVTLPSNYSKDSYDVELNFLLLP